MTVRASASPVVIYVNGPTSGQYDMETPGHLVGELSAPGGRHAGMDPHRIHREFPARWRAYILAHYSSLEEITKAFQVSEKTARNWWTGATGANGGHVAIAVQEHPEEAIHILFAAE